MNHQNTIKLKKDYDNLQEKYRNIYLDESNTKSGSEEEDEEYKSKYKKYKHK